MRKLVSGDPNKTSILIDNFDLDYISIPNTGFSFEKC